MYNHQEVEKKWQKIWQDKNLYKTEDDFNCEKYYILDMFPYPSGEGLHVGHAKGYVATDIMARQKMMQGFSVLHPMGFDAFGLPAENYAIANKIHPEIAMQKNIIRFKEQLEKIGLAYDWSREIKTTDPNYYKWTQWAFLQMFKQGLAYESWEPINWCPSCKTGLANEDLVDGHCERCGTLVIKKPMRQWVLKITDYAERLLNDLDKLDWPESIKEAQRNWIGRSEGAEIVFKITDDTDKITVFTTRPDTLFGVTYLVLAPENELVNKLKDKITNFYEVENYIKSVANKTDIDRLREDKEKTGVELKGLKAINPANNEAVPIWIADYVLNDYGTGAVMAVPAHDDRDFAFAKKYNLAIKQVIAPETGIVRDNEVEVSGACGIIYDPETKKFAIAEWHEGQDIDLLGLFGGNREVDETPEQAALREVAEESGLYDFSLVEHLQSTISHYFNGPKKSPRRAVVDAFLIILNSRATKETKHEAHETFTLGWKTYEEILANWEKLNINDRAHDYDHWIDFLKRGVAHLQEKNLITGDKLFSTKAYCGQGFLCSSDKFTNFNSAKAGKEITKAFGQEKITYKLRDWVFSRQRYWGEPIPVVHCEKDGVVAIDEKDLPLVLPEVEFYEPTDTGESPLANISDWVKTTCPKCGGKALRETNTMPQWAGSSWYYLRYIDPNNDQVLVDKKKEKYWSPVDMYVGGAEHATRHLIYARFWHKFLYDIGVVGRDEPFKRYTNLGLILASDGRKMSKRWKNVINPDDMVVKYGADAFRIYEMFLSPFMQSAIFLESGVDAAKSFLNRVVVLKDKIKSNISLDNKTICLLNQTIKKVGDDINNFKFNTAVSALMILTNALTDNLAIDEKSYSILLQLLAPLAPHISEELWQALGNKESIFKSAWPKYDPKLLINEITTIVVQINGKMRDTFEIKTTESTEEEIKQIALSRPTTQKWLTGKEIKKIIVIKGKVVNIVV
jgi:leucyl-tRNA synthetase